MHALRAARDRFFCVFSRAPRGCGVTTRACWVDSQRRRRGRGASVWVRRRQRRGGRVRRRDQEERGPRREGRPGRPRRQGRPGRAGEEAGVQEQQVRVRGAQVGACFPGKGGRSRDAQRSACARIRTVRDTARRCVDGASPAAVAGVEAERRGERGGHDGLPGSEGVRGRRGARRQGRRQGWRQGRRAGRRRRRRRRLQGRAGRRWWRGRQGRRPRRGRTRWRWWQGRPQVINRITTVAIVSQQDTTRL